MWKISLRQMLRTQLNPTRIKERVVSWLVGNRSWENSYDRRIDFVAQRIKNIETWDESDLWDLRTSLARTIYKRLDAFYPPYSHPGFQTEKEWNEILQKMLFGFWFYGWEATNTWTQFIKDSPLTEKELWEQADKGVQLFGKYFGHLWD